MFYSCNNSVECVVNDFTLCVASSGEVLAEDEVDEVLQWSQQLSFHDYCSNVLGVEPP
jgi:hypothetical protein